MPEAGRLIVCATPIGNLGDVTLRVLDALRAADLVCAEDTRVSRKLLARYEIPARLERFDEHVADARTPKVIARIEAGETVALVSDAGTPGISDPGEHLVAAVLDAGLKVEVLPGPSAILTALVASGMPARSFFFGGFLPRKSGEVRRRLEQLKHLDATLVFYESPARTAAALAFIAEVLPGREAAMARELTKLHEEVVRGTVEELAAEVAGRTSLKGEVVLLVGPPARSATVFDDDDLRSRVRALVAQGVPRSEAVKRVAVETGAPRNRAYRASLGG
ncbi:MAG: 16S rRNA (cytidine(1402)-2'-O)-methyltransferase [Coriobacteriaceae bacterium]|nr:16S rRNA (cytidine(1402)-2'-O)-methyltransferase [Coriobacteriaceae bacterium]